MALTLVLADPHPIFLLGLVQLLASEPDLHVLAHCGNAGEALLEVRRHRPDLLVLDLDLPDRNGLHLIRDLKGDSLPTRAVILTAALDDEQALEALRLGVRGVVLKNMPAHLVPRWLQAASGWRSSRSAAPWRKCSAARPGRAGSLPSSPPARSRSCIW